MHGLGARAPPARRLLKQKIAELEQAKLKTGINARIIPQD
jgi:hypothetical protein